MPRCFVIQPFDKGKFDKRYEDIFEPAIIAAGLEPYRVDRDPSVSIPIEDIQKGIEASALCLADISTDNPNVWFELGYAIAAQRDVVLLCSDERKTKYPFDIQHRTVTDYTTESMRDFAALRAAIEARIKGILQRRESLAVMAEFQSVTKVEGLNQVEMSALVSVAEQVDEPEGGVAVHYVRSAMEQAGFTGIATTIGLKALLMKGMLTSYTESDFNGNEFAGCRVTNSGMEWLLANQDKLTLRKDRREGPNYSDDDYMPAGPPANDDIPF